MAIGVSSIIQAKLFQRMDAQEVLNIQYYIITAMETISDDLSDYAEPMFNTWENLVSPLQHSALTWVRCELYEVNGLDFGVYAPPVPIPGAQTGDAMPSFASVKVQQVRQSRATRHGWKRFAGLPEAATTGNVLTETYRGNFQTAMDALFPEVLVLDSAEFPETRSISFQPIIWGGNDPGLPQGRYSTISEVVVSSLVTTQNTRKRGESA